MIIKNPFRFTKLVPGQLAWNSQISRNYALFERNQGIHTPITLPKNNPVLSLTQGDILAFDSNGYLAKAQANGSASLRRPIGVSQNTFTFNPGQEVNMKCLGLELVSNSIAVWPQAGEIAWLSNTPGEATNIAPTNAVPIGIFMSIGNNIWYNPTIQQ